MSVIDHFIVSENLTNKVLKYYVLDPQSNIVLFIVMKIEFDYKLSNKRDSASSCSFKWKNAKSSHLDDFK